VSPQGTASTREKLLSATLELLEGPGGVEAVTMRAVAAAAGVTAMATYKHFESRDALLRAATAAEYPRIAAYFERAIARRDGHRLRGMLGYLNYALDHPQLFGYMFSTPRADALQFPRDLGEGRSPTFRLLQSAVAGMMERGILRRADVDETALSIWAHAHGLIQLYLCGRIALPRAAFERLYLRSLEGLLRGLSASSAEASLQERKGRKDRPGRQAGALGPQGRNRAPGALLPGSKGAG
jgi:AcrR family transcriptional regulator